ncbi:MULTISPECIES: Rpn family recombination-promoting nuclease/putative transposase [unclassified Duganella]|uniref:Rpn family recombination-promoting nuclease/putative transposase n=1 Tax=unclassified Duganella TaxID=2636909 RepID=UPI00088D73D8|nr:MULTISPECIES: Rpn family recombination-promoting nuclease/putative transposase [unclassified Duganella]SDH53572.1 Predicted transposase YdaD [Duganella sp. OV458]SDK69263.1 Predicted transposase YdaD [Duganella sp. OV510]
MSSRADILYKQLFAHPEVVRDLVAGFLVSDWARVLPVAAFERVNASYASDRGRVRHEDVVWRACIGGEWVYVYILLEFQSRPDKWMALRMQVYVGLLYQDLVAQHKLSKHGKLPPVLPIVLYHGRSPWHAATQLAELMLPAPAGLEHFQASQQYLLIDQHHAGVRADIVSLLFRLLSAGTDAEMRDTLDAVAERIRQRDMDTARESLTRWIQLTLQDAAVQTSMDLEEAFTMKMRRKFTYDEMFDPGMFERPIEKARAQAIIEGLEQGRQQGLAEGRQEGLQEGRQEGLQEGRQQGRQEGRQQGRQEGRQDGERLALGRVLIAVLGEYAQSPQAAAVISAADAEQLNRWIEALFKGVSPQQLLAEGHRD